MLISAPFFALLSLIIFIIGRKQKKLLYIIISAFIMGIGMYSYNTFIIFPIPLFILLCVDLLYYRKAYQLKALLVYICVFVVSASPLLYIMLSDPDFYFSHHRAYSILSTPDFLNGRLWNKSILVLLNGIQNLKSFFIGYHLDHIDSFGEFYNYNIIYLILICIGFLVALIQRKFYPLFILFYVLFLLSSSFFVFEGVYRRQIIAYTLLFYFIALAIQFMYSKVKNTHRNFVSLSLLAVITIVSLHNLYTYFISYAHSEHQKTVFAYEFTQAALKIDTSFKEYPIILYSSRFSCSHESFRFFELDSRCANSSHEFGLLPVQENTHASVHVFLDSYIPEHNQVSKELIITDKYEILDKHTHQVKGVILKSL